MKKAVLILAVLLLITSVSVAYASSTIQAYLFPVTFKFNGEIKQLDQGYTTLNYQDRTYIPARFVAENLGARVGYHADSQTVSFDNSNVFDGAVIEMGDKVAGMEVTDINLEYVEREGTLARYAGTVQFSGEALVSGAFEYEKNSEHHGETLLFMVDSGSASQIPQLTHDNHGLSFAFSNLDQAKNLLGITERTEHKRGRVAVTIAEFLIVSDFGDAVNSAFLKEVFLYQLPDEFTFIYLLGQLNSADADGTIHVESEGFPSVGVVIESEFTEMKTLEKGQIFKMKLEFDGNVRIGERHWVFGRYDPDSGYIYVTDPEQIMEYYEDAN